MAAVPSPPASVDRYDAAIKAFRRRLPMTDEEWRALETVEADKSFWVAGVTQARQVQELYDAIDSAIANGTTLEDFVAQVGDGLEEAWGGPDPVRMETVFRTNVLSAYNAGRNEVMTDPDVMEARPYWRFDDVDDSRECDICAPLHGHIAPADDAFWRSHHPPLHHQCRCILSPLSKDEAHAEGIPDRNPTSAPADDGFGAPPDPERTEPDLSGLDPDIRAELERRLQ